jgi:hypothetical protein
VHVAACTYLDNLKNAMDCANVAFRWELDGDAELVVAYNADAARWGDKTLNARRILGVELRQLRRKEKALYEALDIPPEALVGLGLT